VPIGFQYRRQSSSGFLHLVMNLTFVGRVVEILAWENDSEPASVGGNGARL